MKKMRRLIPAFAMLLVAATMLSTASFAWFTISTTASATGMQVSATASSSLLITDSADKFTAAVGTIDISQQNTQAGLVPATHDASYSADSYHLKAVADASIVNPSTGEYSGTWQAAAKNTNYVEYTVYLGTTGTALTGQYLNAEVKISNDLAYKIHNAVTVDFWVNGNYGGKINLEQVSDGNKTYNIDIAKGLTIPAAVQIGNDGAAAPTNQYVTVVMRVYFDGALLDKTTTDVTTDCYVRNAMSTTTGVGFNVIFKADTTASSNKNTDIYNATPSN